MELSKEEVKNKTELAFDIPPQVAKMLIEYRERIAPKIIGHRPAKLFVNVDGSPKSERTVAWLISTYVKRRSGIVLTPHQFRHLSAKNLLDAQPGAYEVVRQLLGHKRSDTTVNAYAVSTAVVPAAITSVSSKALSHRKIRYVRAKVAINGIK